MSPCLSVPFKYLYPLTGHNLKIHCWTNLKMHTEQYVDGLQSMTAFPETQSGLTCPSYGLFAREQKEWTNMQAIMITTTMIKRQILDMYMYAIANWCDPSIPASQSKSRQPKNKCWKGERPKAQRMMPRSQMCHARVYGVRLGQVRFTFTLSKSTAFIIVPWKNSTVV